ncbi:MAG: ATP-binding cassette domain-containing protein [Gammaproteobacteria bacterium]|nr:ATP-binding cassette domain-containing protein [Gammaproteobacteria bacterium]
MDRQPIIQVQKLVARYDSRTILENISFDIYPGEIFMIIGGSGCGKTTLLNHMIGLLDPYAGNVIVEGLGITNATADERLAVLRRVGVLYQSGALFGSMTLLGNVQLPLEELTELPKDAIKEIAQNKLKMVGLGEFGDYMPAEVSGGMQKRAAIARAMALDPSILFLDEPSAGLDPIIASELDQLIVSLSHTLGITFVIISHDLESIYNIAERVILLHQGQIIASGDPHQMQQHSNPFVRKFFERRV